MRTNRLSKRVLRKVYVNNIKYRSVVLLLLLHSLAVLLCFLLKVLQQQSFPTSDATWFLRKFPSKATPKLCSKVSNKLGPLDYGSFMPLMFSNCCCCCCCYSVTICTVNDFIICFPQCCTKLLIERIDKTLHNMDRFISYFRFKFSLE